MSIDQMDTQDALEALGHNPEAEHVAVPLQHKALNTVLRIDSTNQTVTVQTQGETTEWITSDVNLGIEDTGKYTDELFSGKL